MRKLALIGVAMALGACQCGGEARDAAVRLELSFSGFHPGCLRVEAEDAQDSSRQRSVEVTVAPGERSGTRTLAVYRDQDWSRELKIRAVAHEGSCAGPQVAAREQTVSLPAGEIQPLALALSAADVDQDGFVALGDNGTDCDDAQELVHPQAAERCNAVDDDCDGNVDEDFDAGAACTEGCPGQLACQPNGTLYCAVPPERVVYPDGDGDGRGAADGGSFQVCGLYGPDAGQSASGDDCDDARAEVYPGAPELCDEVDNSCDGQVDEGYFVGSACDPGGGNCLGVIGCTKAGTASCQSSGPPVPQYLDDDLDGVGTGPALLTSCDPPDAGLSLAASDCDDGNRFVHEGAVELCDLLDNDCNGVVDDGAGCLGTPGFVALTQGGNNHDWISVSAWEDGGTGVWIAGVNDELRVRPPGASAFVNQNADCQSGVVWEGAWADPRTGTVHLAGRGGHLATHPLVGSGCAVIDAGNLMDNLSSLHGFETPAGSTFYAVTEEGRSVGWDGGAAAGPLTPVGSAPCLEDVHGLSPQLTFAVGGTSCTGNSTPVIYRLNPAAGAWVPEDLSAAGLPALKLTSVHVVNERLAYAVGGRTDGGSAGVAIWNGTSWGPHLPPDAGLLTGVTAFGRNSLLVVGDKSVWAYADDSWTHVYQDADSLWDVSATSPADVWVVGDNGTVVHWPN
ncbi:MAG: putative metal-binding motif-containing protein [Myxococcota bacterium]|nr:putative metal-binding motif-containing protein [Myxococcota bacterium]